MGIKAIIDSLDDAQEAFRGLYRPGTADEGADGKFVLDVEGVGGWRLEDIAGLKTALGREMTQRKALEKDIAKFRDIDPAKAREAMEALERLGELDPAKEADKIAAAKVEALKQQLLDRHQSEVKEHKDKIAHLTGAIDDLVRRAAATQALAAAKGSVELLLPHVLAHTRVKEENGRFTVEVVDADGNTRIGDAKGAPMTIEGLVAEMRESETFARAFDGEGHSGTGKQPDSPAPAKRGNIGGSREERAEYLAAKYKLPRD